MNSTVLHSCNMCPSPHSVEKELDIIGSPQNSTIFVCKAEFSSSLMYVFLVFYQILIHNPLLVLNRTYF